MARVRPRRHRGGARARRSRARTLHMPRARPRPAAACRTAFHARAHGSRVPGRVRIRIEVRLMCGISGIFGMDGALHPDALAAVRGMNAALAHRGPDGEGFFENATVSLGHRRLAIIDPAGGRQPMTNEDESCWIAFNGEIYNHRDLRPVLESRGHRFRTCSDTETILHAYEEFGPSCVERLEGMFAFAIYDLRRQELFAARDRLGKKPFF